MKICVIVHLSKEVKKQDDRTCYAYIEECENTIKMTKRALLRTSNHVKKRDEKTCTSANTSKSGKKRNTRRVLLHISKDV